MNYRNSPLPSQNNRTFFRNKNFSSNSFKENNIFLNERTSLINNGANDWVSTWCCRVHSPATLCATSLAHIIHSSLYTTYYMHIHIQATHPQAICTHTYMYTLWAVLLVFCLVSNLQINTLNGQFLHGGLWFEHQFFLCKIYILHLNSNT